MSEHTPPANQTPNRPLNKSPNSPTGVQLYNEEMPSLKPGIGNGPKLSIIVIVYKMPEQAKNTLLSLSCQYQRGVSEDDYEIIVVENSSSNVLGEEAALQFGKNFRYFYREEPLPTPTFAVNFGVEQARGETVGVIIDGARMVTPGVINFTLAARMLADKPIIAVPGYHLGNKLQQEAMNSGYNHEVEKELLDTISWPKDGYKLFEISVLSGTCAGGFFKPSGESNCFSFPRAVWDQLGGCDTRFTETGGGQVNLDLYKRAVELQDSTLISLLGEGTFHQFHGGITTGQPKEKRDPIMEAHWAQYRSIRGEPYKPPIKRPIYLGALPDNAMKFIQHSAMITRRNRGEIQYRPIDGFAPGNPAKPDK